VQALLPKLASCYKIIDRKTNFIHTLYVKESELDILPPTLQPCQTNIHI